MQGLNLWTGDLFPICSQLLGCFPDGTRRSRRCAATRRARHSDGGDETSLFFFPDVDGQPGGLTVPCCWTSRNLACILAGAAQASAGSYVCELHQRQTAPKRSGCFWVRHAGGCIPAGQSRTGTGSARRLAASIPARQARPPERADPFWWHPGKIIFRLAERERRLRLRRRARACRRLQSPLSAHRGGRTRRIFRAGCVPGWMDGPSLMTRRARSYLPPECMDASGLRHMDPSP